jgi:hypothetical protein
MTRNGGCILELDGEETLALARFLTVYFPEEGNLDFAPTNAPYVVEKKAARVRLDHALAPLVEALRCAKGLEEAAKQVRQVAQGRAPG